MTKRTLLRISFILVFIVGLFIGTELLGQEATETAPETTITEEGTTTTATSPLESFTTRTVSSEDLEELERARLAVSNASAVFNYVLDGIIINYRINVQTEVLNIKTGRISPRATTIQ